MEPGATANHHWWQTNYNDQRKHGEITLFIYFRIFKDPLRCLHSADLHFCYYQVPRTRVSVQFDHCTVKWLQEHNMCFEINTKVAIIISDVSVLSLEYVKEFLRNALKVYYVHTPMLYRAI